LEKTKNKHIHSHISTSPDDLKKHHDDWDFTKTWEEMQKLPASGRVRAIGGAYPPLVLPPRRRRSLTPSRPSCHLLPSLTVSNFAIKNLNKLFESPNFKTVPAVNQVELHPNNPSPKLIEFNKSKGIHTTAYSCLGSTDSPLMKDQTLAAIAKKHNRNIQQTLLVWGLQRG
jgi:glycerol 2-dehydrogenase (NADP+)